MDGRQDFSVCPSPLGVIRFVGTWLRLVLGGFGTKGLGPGLDNGSKNFKE